MIKSQHLFCSFLILVYTFVNMTTVIYSGSPGDGTDYLVCQRFTELSGFLCWLFQLYILWGGIKAVAWTDVINVSVLILGGLITTAFALNALSDGNGVVAGFSELLDKVPQKLHMIIEKNTLFLRMEKEVS